MPRTHAALIVDSDSKGLESLVYGFQGAGWRITACPAAETASLLIKASSAEIVVAASRSDHDKVHSMVKQLRSREAFRGLPVLVLGPEELRGPIKEHGQVDLLPLPAFVRDVLTASRMLVRAGATAAPNPGDEPCFEDSTTARDSLSLVRTMNGLARSGSLHLVRKGRRGEILFHEGELTAAKVGHLQGMAAAQHLLVWNDGNLELRLRPVVRRGQLHHTAQEFLEEFDRFQRDYSHAIKDIGPPSTVYLVNHDRLHASTGAIPAEVTPVVRLCDGRRALSDVIDESPFRVLDTARILGRLVELSILNRRDAKPATAPEEITPLDAFWATACITVGGVAQEAARTSKPMPIPPEAEDPSMQKTPPPVDVKPRSPRQTQEIGKPAAPTSNSLAPQPAANALPAVKPATELGSSTARGNLDSATPVEAARRVTPAFGVGLSGLRPSPARGVPLVQAPAPPAAQTSGAFELKRAHHQAARPAETRRSIVIDTALVNVVASGPAAAAPATDPANVASAGNTAPVRTATPAHAPAVVASTAAVAGAGPTPDEKDEKQTTSSGSVAATPSVSVELLAADRAAQVDAVPLAEAKKEPSGARVTGELRVASSGRSPRGQARVGATSSFQIDPSLTVDVPVAKAEPPRESPPGPQPNQGVHRPSGSFSAIESDFFEREADLYKVDKTESFADLDERQSASKSKPAGGPDKRR